MSLNCRLRLHPSTLRITMFHWLLRIFCIRPKDESSRKVSPSLKVRVMKKIFRDFTTSARSQSSYVSCFHIMRVHHQSRRPRASMETAPRRSPKSPLNARPLALSSVSSLRCLNRGKARTNKEGMRARRGKKLHWSRESCSLSLKFYLYMRPALRSSIAPDDQQGSGQKRIRR